MARIPQYTSTRQPSDEAPAVMKQDQKVGVPATPVENIAGREIGQAVSALGEKMIQVENYNAESRAKIFTTSEKLAYKEEVIKNPDAFKQVDEKLQTIGDEAAKNFENPQAREVFKQEWELESIIFKNGLQTKVMEIEVDEGRTNTLREMDLELSNYINAVNDREKLDSRQKMEVIMTEAVKLGLFSQEKGYKEVERVLKSGDTIIQDNKRLDKRKEKELALAQKEAINNREQELIELRVNMKDEEGNAVGLDELIKMARNDMNRGDINSKFAETYINACTSPKAVNAKTDFGTYSMIMSAIVNPNKTATEIKGMILDAHADGQLSDADRNSLLFVGKLKQDPIFKKSIEEQRPNLFQTMWNGIKNYFGGKEKEQSEVMSGTIKRVQTENHLAKDISIPRKDLAVLVSREAIEELRKHRIEQYPWIINLPKEGESRMFPDGIVRTIFPDGRIEEE